MQTLTIDIINKGALRIIQDLEVLKLIHVRKESSRTTMPDWSKYKGAMTKQTLPEVEKQLKDIRNGWE